jgi:hypothetical protein
MAPARSILQLVVLPACACLATLTAPAWGDEAVVTEKPARDASGQRPRSSSPAPARRPPGRKAVPDAQSARQHPRKTVPSVSLPARRRVDRGKGTETGALLGDAKIDKAQNRLVPEEHVIAPIVPAPFAPAPAATPLAPPERPVLPVGKPATPRAEPVLPVENTVTSAEQTATTAAETAATAEKLAAAAAKLAATAEKLAAIAEKLAVAAAQANAARSSRVARGERPAAALPPKASTAPTVAPAGREQASPPQTQPAVPEQPEPVVLDEAVFDKIRLEIKSRLPYFQACADAARRRGSAEVRRVTATWTIAADGAIKEMKIDGVPDPQLATCITRMGSHPFAVQPGAELIIPTPIVFVR